MQCLHPESLLELYNVTTLVLRPDPDSHMLLDPSCADLSAIAPSLTLVPLFDVLLTQAHAHLDSQPRMPPPPRQPS
jgi:hypothetical protein